MGRYISRISFDGKLDENSYLNDLPIIRFLSQNIIEFDSPVTFFVGENGTGKSTLLEAIAVAYGFNAEGGTKNFTFSTKKRILSCVNILHFQRKRSRKTAFSYVRKVCTTHSPILMAFPDAKIFELTTDGINEVDYRETEHYRTTKDFLNDPERMLHYLFNT